MLRTKNIINGTSKQYITNTVMIFSHATPAHGLDVLLISM